MNYESNLEDLLLAIGRFESTAEEPVPGSIELLEDAIQMQEKILLEYNDVFIVMRHFLETSLAFKYRMKYFKLKYEPWKNCQISAADLHGIVKKYVPQTDMRDCSICKIFPR